MSDEIEAMQIDILRVQHIADIILATIRKECEDPEDVDDAVAIAMGGLLFSLGFITILSEDPDWAAELCKDMLYFLKDNGSITKQPLS